jgi:hypothetical protein
MTDRILGLLINFNVPVLKEGIKRVIVSSKLPSSLACFAPWRLGGYSSNSKIVLIHIDLVQRIHYLTRLF